VRERKGEGEKGREGKRKCVCVREKECVCMHMSVCVLFFSVDTFGESPASVCVTERRARERACVYGSVWVWSCSV